MASVVRSEADQRVVGNLPLELTSFVGRRRELAEARRLFESSRLLTLTGIGGVGKTRLAIRLASALQRVFRDGAWLVELGEQTDPELLEDYVAVILGVRPVSSSDPLHTVIDYCSDRSLLLVLDNCEHLVDAVALFAGAILRRCAGVKILATSRESLGMGGEVTMRVPSLTTPQQQPREFEGLAQYESVSLFTERAASVVPGFTLTEENKRAVAHICHDLDGLPLPIELAAARLRGMSAEQIMDRLSDRYRLLTSGGRDVPSRQQTLRLSIDWSYDLCSPPEQQLWGRLTVFSGGFELDAAEGVCGQDSSSTEVLDLVTALVEKSILIREEIDGTVRYHLLDLLREYGREKAEFSNDYVELRRRHRDWFEALVVRAESEWISDRQAAWIARLGREQHNVYDALEFSISTTGEARSATRMVGALYRFWLSGGLLVQARYWTDRALNTEDRELDPFRVDVLAIDAVNHAMQGELERAQALVDESWLLANALADVRSRGLAAWGDGYVDTFRGNFDTATAKLESALTLFRLDENLLHVVIGLDTLGIAYFLSGALDRSVECNEETLAITVPANEVMFQAFALGTLGLVGWLRGELDDARDYLTRSLRILDAPMNSAWCIEPLAWIAAAQRDWKNSAVLLGAAAMYWQKVGGRLAGLPGLSPHHDTAAETARRAMGKSAFDKSFRNGFVMSEGEAVAYALDERRSVPGSSSTEAPHLTRREQQVAELVARGLTNRAIAEHLVISLRTAQGHVEHVLTKLGFTSRAQIAAWFVSTEQETDSRG
ncbi:AAA family ATPase [Rhodococcus erythropolis]|uniref:ATP-binding protein n=1 Tax=Rhodococcus TaxID=1827 RepID=UPI0008A35CD3|nr:MULTISPECIES: LuxR C-terminal-related transcriptional regulator [Rhodococcus]MBT1253435.1 AAA family ATPase [Rhodococcus erythropolis]NRH31681.1 LuxR family transcriptional regulator [Rhodococcus sp. MS13]OHF29527.1 LuxR family transcriptional regulator [Rhodococcus erythropolis]